MCQARTVRRMIDREHVVAVHDLRGNAIAGAAIGDVRARHLHLERRRVGVLVVVADVARAELLHGGEIDALVPVAAAGGAVAEIAERRRRSMPLILQRHRAPGSHRDDAAIALMIEMMFSFRSPMCMLPSRPRVSPPMRPMYCAKIWRG